MQVLVFYFQFECYQTWYCTVLHKQSLVCSCFSCLGWAHKALMAVNQETASLWWELYHPAKCRKHRASVWYGNFWPAVNALSTSDTWFWTGESLRKGPGWGRRDVFYCFFNARDHCIYTYVWFTMHTHSLSQKPNQLSHLITALMQ